jgi:hypothetical protein
MSVSSFETGEGFFPQAQNYACGEDPSSGGLRPPPSPTRGLLRNSSVVIP